jgi:hypothetical protein
MADLQGYRVTMTGQAAVQVPRADIEFQVTDSETGTVLQDRIGANAVKFPATLRDLSDARFRVLLEEIIGPWLAREVGGLN